MAGITIPSFPSQDLAKLVLGYLAEEQLMTAYDEFLQASPYLDALQNEYDRIFMTSLKNILAEYRAVKIFVETCKPFALRKKLCQCTNLLDVVKYLVSHIDTNKIINQDNNVTRLSSDKLHSTTTTKTNVCEVCSSLKLLNCVCGLKHTDVNGSSTQSMANINQSGHENSVETTPLSDLPGNHVTLRKKHVKVLEKDVSMSLFNSSCDPQENGSNNSTCIFKNMSSSSNKVCTMSTTINDVKLPVKTTESLESLQKIQEFNDVLKLVCNTNTHNSNIQQDKLESKLSTGGTFQDFSTGVTGSGKSNIIVPDSSTCDNINVQMPVTKEASSSMNAGSKKVKRGPKTQYLLKVANENVNLDSRSYISDVIDIDSIDGRRLPRVKPKGNESKVTILSNVKVDNEALTSNLKMPAVLKNATSTPMTKMQTILINGTPVYKPHPMSSIGYTTDEIMAMPTIIITPVSGPPPLVTTQRMHYASSQKNDVEVPIIADVAPKSLEPLSIDVSSSVTLTTEKSNLPSQPQQHEICNEASLIQTIQTANADQPINTINNIKSIETVTSASVPKDNIIPGIAVTSTPQVIPLMRKSSSTPRRTSHVRVLDFATPRRILHEAIDERASIQNTAAEVIISKNSSSAIPNVENIVNTSDINNDTSASGTRRELDKNKIVVKRSKNWDADLRALLGDGRCDIPKSQSKCKSKSTKKKKLETPSQNKSASVKKTPAKKKKKHKKKSISPVKITEDAKNIPDHTIGSEIIEEAKIKPTINIISRNDRDKCNLENKKKLNKSNIEEHDTPEGDRMLLPNVIGARLNISDLLETPYKQALYDIQMETPKFLGDLPDVPMSDIKIMNIPTPRFLNSSKGAQATPSPYCSRPTDYSSGGSYYKPDDQDYLPLPEHLGCPEILSKETVNVDSQIKDENESIDNNENSDKLRPSRPVRQCTKNVSYYNSSNLHSKDKAKGMDESFEEDSSFCDSASSLSEKKTNKENISKIPTENALKTKPKLDKSKNSNSKKCKSPVKKDVSKLFMKIRPRRTTPVKCVKNEKTKRKSSESSLSLKSKCPRKRTTSKERNLNSIPAVTVVPTKSRRKSSTPRKLHCTKTFNSESSGHNSPDIGSKDKTNVPQEPHLLCVLDSDNEQLQLRWSEDGSQDAKYKEQQETANEIEDITKIQEYIKTTVSNKMTPKDSEGSLHNDLVKRGFDIETAKIIERDLLDTPPYPKHDTTYISKPVETMEAKTEDTSLNKTLESETSLSNNLQIVQDEPESDEDEIVFCGFECNEDSTNYFTCQYDETKMPSEAGLVKLRDKFCMEVCIDDDVTVRLRATPFILTVDLQPQNEEVIEYNQREIEAAVRTICEINTPLKESIKAQCFEIFDSTLTSLDTPLKATSPRKKEPAVTVTEIVLEVEKLDVKEKPDSKKRKRIQSGNTSDESVTDSKKVKSDAQYLFNSANIQNIDIESVLSKLHGP